jgi:hypothetical protein
MINTDPITRLVAAFNKHDPVAFAAAFAPDAVITEYPATIVAQGPAAIAAYFTGLFTAFPAAQVELRARIDLGMRQITHERFYRGDGSPMYDAVLVYTLSGPNIARLDFIREVQVD